MADGCTAVVRAAQLWAATAVMRRVRQWLQDQGPFSHSRLGGVVTLSINVAPVAQHGQARLFAHGLPSSAVQQKLCTAFGNCQCNSCLPRVRYAAQAAEPFFSVLFSALFLGDVPPTPVLLTLVPIVGGVVIASVSEVTFNWTGDVAAGM